MDAPAPTLARQIADCRVSPGTLGVWWLGGSGFVFKTAAGRQVWIDPYLSDFVREVFGVGRAFPPPLAPDEAAPDVVISTHWHEDHLDPGFIPALARRRPAVRFIMPRSAMARAVTWGLTTKQISPLGAGETLDLPDGKVTGVVARHEAGVPGWEVPDAIGACLELDGLRIYHTGDTDYDPRIHRALTGQAFALATLCINGSVGNMNAAEAALLAWHLDARAVVPHHHLIWDRPKEKIAACETLDPGLFAETYRRLGGKGAVVIPEVGRGMLLTATGLVPQS
jgi:L-ascorbate 6-phosphate lactonase